MQHSYYNTLKIQLLKLTYIDFYLKKILWLIE